MNSFRLDRFLTLYFFYPLLRFLPQEREPRIPILMYHSISENKIEAQHPYFETNTSLKVFSDHMKYLHENSYSVVSLNDVVEYLKGEKILQKKSVAITFDDGFCDFYKDAFPVLEKYGFSVAMFLSTAFINNKRLNFLGKECLTWDEIRELRKKEVIFGSHTVNHPNLYLLKSDEIEFEIRRSKEKIEDEIGGPINSFSYPFAFPEQDKKFKEKFRSLLEKCRYKYGVTTNIGTTMRNNDIYFLKRIPVNSFDDSFFFETKLEGRYNWLYSFQYLFKLLKSYQNSKNRATV